MAESSVTVGCCMMIKNEEKRIRVTLDSIKGFVDCLIFYDTGSTDNTLSIVRQFAEEAKLPLHLKEGEFVDFSTSRNILLNYADTINVDFLLLLDCNDELKRGDLLRKDLETYKNDLDREAFMVYQEWLAGTDTTKYKNVRVLRNHTSWRYKKKIHEFLHRTKVEENPDNAPVVVYDRTSLNPEIIVYQNRNEDDDKTGKRFARDKLIFLEEIKADPVDPRDMFYLAQTCACLNEHEEAIKYYSERVKLVGFWEERFQAYLRMGEIYVKHLNDWDKALPMFMKAFTVDKRAEPLVQIGKYYRESDQFLLAYMFLKQACELPFPHYANLFVNKKDYEYLRYHLMGIVCYYVDNKNLEGKEACLKAIESGHTKERDEANLKFYVDRLKAAEDEKVRKDREREEIIKGFQSEEAKKKAADESKIDQSQPKKDERRSDFVFRRTNELRVKFPGLTSKQLDSKAQAEWKRRNKK